MNAPDGGSESGAGDASRTLDDGTADGGTTGGASDAPPSRVRLRILDKEVQLACPPDEQDGLLQAAAYIDRAMRELRQRNTTSSFEKIAIVTAINTASALLEARARAGEDGDALARVARLNARLDELLTEEPEA